MPPIIPLNTTLFEDKGNDFKLGNVINANDANKVAHCLVKPNQAGHITRTNIL